MTAPAPSPAPGRSAYIDTLRGWSIFGVVCVHFAGSFVTTDTHAWSPSFQLGLALNQGFSFAVPLFVFLSGLLAGLSRRHVSLGEYYAGRCARILVPYLLASIASFYLLNHYQEWAQLPRLGARFGWLLQRVFFSGVEPTLYFIPLILQLYLLQPLLAALPGWLHRRLPAVRAESFALVLTVALLALHAGLGLACNQGRLNYYVWGRPNVLFWMFYFFAGLHFRALAAVLSARAWKFLAAAALLVAAGAMAWNFRHLLDRGAMGDHFQFNRLDFAYARPEMLVYDLAAVIVAAAGVQLAWNVRAGLAAYLGRYSLEIYLWHILVLYYGAWRYSDALDSCRRQPELIVLICFGAALALAWLADRWAWLRAYVRDHRVAVLPAK